MSMHSRLCFVALAVFAVATIFVENADAATITVGGDSGWRIPTSSDPALYDTFASQATFTVGDVLVFNFPTGIHDVAPVSKEAYDACNASAAISLLTVGPASVTLTSTGLNYYICTFGTHCQAGQKLAVNVTGSSLSPSPTPLPPTSAPPSPLPNTPSPTPSVGPSPSSTASPPSEGPSPSGSAPSEGPSPTGSAPSEGPSPTGSAPSEGPSPTSSTTPPSPGSTAAPGSLPSDADGSVPPPPSIASKTSAATIFVGIFISAAVGFMF